MALVNTAALVGKSRGYNTLTSARKLSTLTNRSLVQVKCIITSSRGFACSPVQCRRPVNLSRCGSFTSAPDRQTGHISGQGLSNFRLFTAASDSIQSKADDSEADFQVSALDEEDAALTDTEPPRITFETLKVDKVLRKHLRHMRIEEPSGVQIASADPLREGKNLAIQSFTGSGKTIAYLAPLMSRAIEMDRTQPEIQPIRIVVVAPSRELAMQITRVAQEMVGPDRREMVQQLIGGANIRNQQKNLKKNRPMMVVGTPGRVAELSRSGHLLTHRCSMLVLDEVDQLLGDSFMDPMTRITAHIGKKCPEGRQTVIVSATLTSQVLERTELWCPEPEFVSVSRKGGVQRFTSQEMLMPAADPAAPSQVMLGTSDGTGTEVMEMHDPAAALTPMDELARVRDLELPDTIGHFYIRASRRDRVYELRRAIWAVDAQRALIFMNYAKRLKDTAAKLSSRGLPVASLHGDLSKHERQNVLAKLQKGEIRALCVTDVAARGLDIPELDAVFNLELPLDASSYAHRAGRTGRMGTQGLVVNVAEKGEGYIIGKMEKQLAIEIVPAECSHGELRPLISLADMNEQALLKEQSRLELDEGFDDFRR